MAGERVNQDWPIFLNGQQLSYVHQGEDAQVRCWRGTEAQRVAYYAEQAATLRPETFRRLHLNQWAGREGEFLPVEVWDKLYEPGLELRPGDKKSSLVIGIDASVSGDATALCVVSRHPERHDDIAVRAMHVWLPPAGGQIDYSTTLLPTLLHYCENHNTVQVTFDPFQMHHFFNQFRERGLVWCKAFDQGQARIMADSALYQRLLAGGLRHDGNPIARRHFQNCASKSTDDSRLRIIKRGRGPIDAIVALSMASWECSRLLL